MSFALKYRPTLLDEMVGQEAAVLQVRGLFSNKKSIPQSILITGPTGSGKTTLARIISRLANDLSPDDTKLIDTQEIDGAEARGIDDVRQLIRASKYAPKKNYRIYILDEIHQWTPPAKQAFLKTLEEPSARTVFILCTNEPEKLPATIKGRCHQIRLGRISPEVCCTLLQRVAKAEGLDLPAAALLQVATVTQGHPRDALQALEAVGNYARGGGDVTDADSVLTAVEQVVPVPPTDYLHKYLLSIYKGKYTTALRVASYVDNADYFLMCAMDAHEQAMFSLISPKLLVGSNDRWTSKLKEADVTRNTMDVEVMSDMLDEMLKSIELIKTYTVDAKRVLTALTARLVTLQRRSAKTEERY